VDNGTNRFATVFLYLTDVEEGGHRSRPPPRQPLLPLQKSISSIDLFNNRWQVFTALDTRYVMTTRQARCRNEEEEREIKARCRSSKQSAVSSIVINNRES
jgi:hypothetical protein